MDKSRLKKRNKGPLSYHSPGISTDWQHKGDNFANLSIGLVPNSNSMAVCEGIVGPSCSTSSMVGLFGPTVWENSVNAEALGFPEMNVPNGPNSSDPLSMLKTGLFLPNMPEMLPQSLSQFPADSAFIECATQFPSFNDGHFGDKLNPFGNKQSTNPYVQAGSMKPLPVRPSRKTAANIVKALKDVSVNPKHGNMEGGTPKNGTTVERSYCEVKQVVSVSIYDSDEAGFSGSDLLEVGTPSLAKEIDTNKRKRGNQEAEPKPVKKVLQQSGEARKSSTGTEHKGDLDSTPTDNKPKGKNGRQSLQSSDPPKDEYMHVRARRGQATNSHSLAERVRREKISERMKFLQDLVPGCSKVTGKAVMLDEIINYVQSLQRQVEFLSMKLATVNPQLEFNIEQLLAKDIISARAGPLSGLRFSPEMSMDYHSLHPSQPDMFQTDLLAIGNSSDALRRTIKSHMVNVGGGCKESTAQLPNSWANELHNIVQMGFNASAPVENQETNGSVYQVKPNPSPDS